MTDSSWLRSPIITPEIEARFWKRVDKSPGHGPKGECWVWLGALAPHGYPHSFQLDGKNYRPSQVALAIDGKSRPSGEMQALHDCDFKPCVRPDHLHWGTTQQNTAEFVERRGESKRWLSPDDVREIRGSSERHVDLAKRFGVTSSAICNIRKGVSHKHVK